jgi:DNA-binding response OmpR family regulator
MPQTALVVEDDLSLAQAINKKLQLSGFTTVSARSVDDALKLMQDQQSIGVIWLDHYLLGDKDGLAFATAVKAEDDWRQIPIYIVSNTASTDKVASYHDLGINHYYVKADHRLDEIIADIKAGTGPA